MLWWWLSFCDPDRPQGQRFLGACIVQASDHVSAIKIAHVLKINPGGEVLSRDCDPAIVETLPAKYIERLLTRAEISEVERFILGRGRS